MLYQQNKDSNSFSESLKFAIGITHQPELTALKALLEINHEIAAASDREQLKNIVMDHFNLLVPFCVFLITLVDHQTKTHQIWLMGGNKETGDRSTVLNRTKKKYPIDDPFLSQFLPVLEPVSFSIIEQEHAMPLNILDLGLIGMREASGMTLFKNGKEIGLFILLSNESGHFQDSHMPLFKGLAKQLSLAITNIVAAGESTRQKEEQAKERTALLAISNDLSTIRNKNDLQSILDKRLKEIFFFTHTLTIAVDASQGTYRGFIFDPESRSKNHQAYQRIINAESLIREKIMIDVMHADGPVVVDLAESLALAALPDWAMMNYESGIIEIVIAPLKIGSKFIGCFILFSNRKGNFQKSHLQIIQGISWQLSNSVGNILANEEIFIREQEKSLLLAFSNSLAGVRSREDLVNMIKEGFESFSMQQYLVSLVTPDQLMMNNFLYDNNFEMQDGYQDFKNDHYPVTGGLSEIVLRSEQPVIFALEEMLSGRKIKDFYLPFLSSSVSARIMGVPIKAGHKNFGIIWTHHDKSTERMIKNISSQIAIALANVIANEQISIQLSEIENYKQQLEMEKIYLQEEIKSDYNYGEIIGNSHAISKVFHMVSQVAATNSSVLLMGDTGTGKELIARAIHNSSLRKKNLMVKVNCAAMPANLVESELFGHERGSFTGATERRIGKFELANNSTLFLDEVGELPLDMQVKLLRALQEKEIERVGGRGVIKTDVRIIAATNRNLHKEVQLGNFRSDLFFRLNVFPIMIPSLNDRREDIPALAHHFLIKHANKNVKDTMVFSNRVMSQLMDYDWPGNVRELEHLVERSVLLTSGNIIGKLYLNVPGEDSAADGDTNSGVKTIDEVEREHIISVLKKCNNKISGKGGAAELLKIPSTTLNSKIRRLRIKKGFSELL